MKIATALRAACLLGPLAFAGCAGPVPLEEYRPVVDPARTDMSRFERDLAECRQIALRVEADLRRRRDRQRSENIVTGALIGAAVGTAIGSGASDQGDWIAYGAGYGAVAGAAATDRDYGRDRVVYEPRRIVDRCVSDRGHVLLNDVPGQRG